VTTYFADAIHMGDEVVRGSCKPDSSDVPNDWVIVAESQTQE
jgi:hypothetical protein